MRTVVEAKGGVLIGCWMAFGDHDILVIVDKPPDEAMAGVAFPKTVSTAPGGKTTKLLTMA